MTVLVQDEDKFVYKVEMVEQQASEFYYLLNLELVCGWDYVSEDSDIQGYVLPENFTEDIQHISLTFYPMNETIIQRLQYDGYKAVDVSELKIEGFLARL